MIATRTNHDEPASSEPNSIAPFAVDVNRWEIDLRNLRSGERIDFATPHFDDEPELTADTSRAMPLPLGSGRGRMTRHIFGAVAATLLVGGLGFAALRGRPTPTRAAASSNRAAVVAPATPAVIAPPSVTATSVAPAPVAPAPVAAEPPASRAAVSAADLPNAKGKARVNKGKRFLKRAK